MKIKPKLLPVRRTNPKVLCALRCSLWAVALAAQLVALGCDSSTKPPADSVARPPQADPVARMPADTPIVGLRRPAAIHLDYPGALDRLRAENPEHFRKISAILAGLKTRTNSEAASWAKVKFDAQEFELGNIYLVSFPAKQRLSFSLDGTEYVATVVQPGTVHPPSKEPTR